MIQAAPTSDIKSAAGAGSNECLALSMGREDYGIDILKVQEIRGYDTLTQVANPPDFVMIVINLRSSIVPSYDQFTAVIIMNIGRRAMGIVVHSASDVITL